MPGAHVAANAPARYSPRRHGSCRRTASTTNGTGYNASSRTAFWRNRKARAANTPDRRASRTRRVRSIRTKYIAETTPHNACGTSGRISMAT